MARSDSFDGLSEFLAIVRQGSFRAAAIELGVTAGAVSQALQALERRLGLPLFHRTTRKVSMTEAGEKLLTQLAPAADVITATLDELAQLRAKPSGTLRLLVQRAAVPHVIEPILPAFHRAWPELKVEITIEDSHASIVADGHDAGIRIGEFIDRDMVAVRVSPSFSWLVMGAPSYFSAHGRPRVLEDIAEHQCIRYRRPDVGDVYRWEFERDGQSLSIEPPGSLVVNDSGLVRTLAAQGLGLIYTSSLLAAPELQAGLLEPVLEAFAPSRDAFFLYFPRASRNQPKLRAFVDACARGVR
jgi:DNA-binding transcriptional LysR family regulator